MESVVMRMTYQAKSVEEANRVLEAMKIQEGCLDGSVEVVEASCEGQVQQLELW